MSYNDEMVINLIRFACRVMMRTSKSSDFYQKLDALKQYFRVIQFGSRSGPTYCPIVWSRSKLFGTLKMNVQF